MPLTASRKGGRQLVITVRLCQTSVSMTALMLALPAQGRAGTDLQCCIRQRVLVGCRSATMSKTTQNMVLPVAQGAAVNSFLLHWKWLAYAGMTECRRLKTVWCEDSGPPTYVATTGR